jgi:alpha-L-fucosidase
MPTGDLMRRVMNLLLLNVSLLVPLNAQTYEPTWDSVDKRPIPAWFSEAKFEIFIHWGTYAVPSYSTTSRT